MTGRGRPPSRIAALVFKALSDPTRLRIFDYLRCAYGPVAVGRAGKKKGETAEKEGEAGTSSDDSTSFTVGEVCLRVTGGRKSIATISHHLKELRQAGLITMERRGKHRVCSVNEEAVADLARYLYQPLQDKQEKPIIPSLLSGPAGREAE